MNIVIYNRAETIFLRTFHPIPPARTLSMVPFRTANHKWRSSLNADDKCHPENRMVGITSVSPVKLRYNASVQQTSKVS